MNKIRVLFSLAISVASCQALAQTCDSEPYKRVIDRYFAGKEIDARLSSCSTLPSNSKVGVAAFVFQRPESDDTITTYDVELMLFELGSPSVSARLSLNKVWDSDAYKIDSAGISSVVYPVHAGSHIFGLTEAWSASSSVSFYSIQKLSLFERQGGKIVPLLSGLVTDVYQGEGCDVKTSRKLSIAPQRGKDYAPIKVVERSVGITREAATCDRVDTRPHTYILKAQDGKYSVPDALRPFGEPQ